jgi:hypothetical protein
MKLDTAVHTFKLSEKFHFGYVARIREMRNVLKIMSENVKGREFWSPRLCRWEDNNIRIDLRGVG